MDYNILRENDIRGEYGTQITSSVAKRIGLSFGTYLKLNEINETIIGHDNRLSGEELHTALIEGILETGVNILDIGLSTTSLFNYSSIKAEIPYGIMITANGIGHLILYTTSLFRNKIFTPFMALTMRNVLMIRR